MNFKLNAKSSIVAVAAGLIGFAGAASASTIDLFTDPNPGFQTVTVFEPAATPASASSQFGSAPSILGGYRDVVVTMNSRGGPELGPARSEAFAGNGGFIFNNTTGVSGTARIQWDGDDSANVALLNHTGLRNGGLTGVDLVNQVGCPVTGCDRFIAGVTSADQGFQYQIGLYTDAGNFSVLTTSVPFQVNALLFAEFPFEVFLRATGNYNDLAVPFSIARTGTGPTLTNIGAIEFVANSDGGTLAVDLSISAITKTGVPEPGTLALMGLGFLAAAGIKRRRSAKAAA